MSENSQYKIDRLFLLNLDLEVKTVYQVKTKSGLVVTQRADERAAITDAAFQFRKIIKGIKDREDN